MLNLQVKFEVEASKYFSCAKHMYLAFPHLISRKFGELMAPEGTCLLAHPRITTFAGICT